MNKIHGYWKLKILNPLNSLIHSHIHSQTMIYLSLFSTSEGSKLVFGQQSLYRIFAHKIFNTVNKNRSMWKSNGLAVHVHDSMKNPFCNSLLKNMSKVGTLQVYIASKSLRIYLTRLSIWLSCVRHRPVQKFFNP